MNTSNYKNIIMVSSVRLSIQIYFFRSMLLKEKKNHPKGSVPRDIQIIIFFSTIQSVKTS